MKHKVPWIIFALVVVLALVTEQYNLLIAAVGVAMIFAFYFLVFRVLWRFGSKPK